MYFLREEKARGLHVTNFMDFTFQECEFLCLLSSFLNGDSYHAYNFARELVVKHSKNHRVWNLFNLVITR